MLLAATLLAACGVTVSGTFGDVGDEHPVHETGEANSSSHPSTPPGADGSIELVSDFVAGGSGVSIAEAIEVAGSHPVLVNGLLLRDADGAIWFCTRRADASPPDCAAPKLIVLDFPTEPDLFDPAVAEAVGATTRDGITWLEGHQLYGIVHPPNGD
jgi:hypothetical protein